jgi:hypothetical protein
MYVNSQTENATILIDRYGKDFNIYIYIYYAF